MLLDITIKFSKISFRFYITISKLPVIKNPTSFTNLLQENGMVMTTRSNKTIVTSYDFMFKTAYANNQEIIEKDKMTLNGVVHSVSELLFSGFLFMFVL